MSVIKSGYRITVTSWENDADNYRTIVLDGLSKETTQKCVKICKLLAQCWYDGPENFGNMSSSYSSRAHDKFDMLDIDTDMLHELGLSSENFSTRVCESYEINYIPEDIKLNDIAPEFV